MTFSLKVDESHVYDLDIYTQNIKDKYTIFYNHDKSIIDEINFNINVLTIREMLISNEVLAY